jgi:leucine dehydrogenase
MIDPEKLPQFDRHAEVVDLSRAGSPGLRGFIAIHRAHPSPALGGTRVFMYKNESEALTDALQLSEAMTYKCALAGVPFAGAKGVIIADPRSPNFHELLRSYASEVNKLKGRFYTGEDMGLTLSDVQFMLQYSEYFIGKAGQAGDPSAFASLSTFRSIEAALEQVYETSDFSGRTFAIKGVGKTGKELIKLIVEAGGTVIAGDSDEQALSWLRASYPKIKIVNPAVIHEQDVDVYCPCAFGNDIREDNLSSLKVRVIAGTANNQLESLAVGRQLYQRGILHVPSNIANAGGLINVADELLPGGYQRTRVLKGIDDLQELLRTVLAESARTNQDPDAVAQKLSVELLKRHQEISQLVSV